MAQQPIISIESSPKNWHKLISRGEDKGRYGKCVVAILPPADGVYCCGVKVGDQQTLETFSVNGMVMPWTLCNHGQARNAVLEAARREL